MDGVSSGCGSRVPSAWRWHAGLARALLVRGDVATILHAEGREDLVAEIDVERLPADRLDETADPVDVDAVFPLVAGVEDQRRSAATLPVAVEGISVALT